LLLVSVVVLVGVVVVVVVFEKEPLSPVLSPQSNGPDAIDPDVHELTLELTQSLGHVVHQVAGRLLDIKGRLQQEQDRKVQDMGNHHQAQVRLRLGTHILPFHKVVMWLFYHFAPVKAIDLRKQLDSLQEQVSHLEEKQKEDAAKNEVRVFLRLSRAC